MASIASDEAGPPSLSLIPLSSSSSVKVALRSILSVRELPPMENPLRGSKDAERRLSFFVAAPLIEVPPCLEVPPPRRSVAGEARFEDEVDKLELAREEDEVAAFFLKEEGERLREEMEVKRLSLLELSLFCELTTPSDDGDLAELK